MASDPVPPDRERALGMTLIAIAALFAVALIALAIYAYLR
jgi:hypothetical protein